MKHGGRSMSEQFLREARSTFFVGAAKFRLLDAAAQASSQAARHAPKVIRRRPTHVACTNRPGGCASGASTRRASRRASDVAAATATTDVAASCIFSRARPTCATSGSSCLCAAISCRIAETGHEVPLSLGPNRRMRSGNIRTRTVRRHGRETTAWCRSGPGLSPCWPRAYGPRRRPGSGAAAGADNSL